MRYHKGILLVILPTPIERMSPMSHLQDTESESSQPRCLIMLAAGCFASFPSSVRSSYEGLGTLNPKPNLNRNPK